MKYLHGQSTEMEKAYCNLKFDRHTYTFVNLLDDFRLKELYCDATIACDGKKYPVHQVVLSACSDFFANIFASGSCQNPLVVLQDVSSSHLESLLTYMYRGEVQVPQCDLPEFLKAAKSLFLKGLMIPHLEKYSNSESITGTWHEPYYGPEDGMARLHATNPSAEHVDIHGHFPPPAPRMQFRDEVTDHPSFRSHVPVNGIRVEDHLRRQNMIERVQYAKHDRMPHKRPHYVMEFPQDLRVPHELNHEKHVSDNKEDGRPVRSHARWEDGDSLRIARAAAVDAAGDVDPRERKRLKSTETKEHVEERVSPITKYSFSESSHGTFQELIAADESTIKQEPEDVINDCGKEEIEDSQDDDDEEDDEHPLQIAEDQDDMPEESTSDSRCNGLSDTNDDSKSFSQMPEVYSGLSDPSGSPQRHLSPNSQLRRELLRPVPQAFGHLQQRPHANAPQGIPQSIPHPVIALRESQGQAKAQPQPVSQPALREPPPLMKIPQKIPSLISDTGSDRAPPRSFVKDMQVNRRNSHLLVTAPPSYHPHNPSNHFCFEIHNQQLGPVLVNGGSHISLSSPSAFSPPKLQNNNKSNFTYDSDGPLNLSGVQRPSSKSPECLDSGDPFLGKIVTNRKKRLRGPKSWEFLVRLLKDPTTNPNLIRWENESNCIFRLVQPAIIAQRWGRRTGKHASENLSYENFARGLRYHYATGALKPVSEKSFVYRFGPKAIKLLEECDSTAFPYI